MSQPGSFGQGTTTFGQESATKELTQPLLDPTAEQESYGATAEITVAIPEEKKHRPKILRHRRTLVAGQQLTITDKVDTTTFPESETNREVVVYVGEELPEFLPNTEQQLDDLFNALNGFASAIKRDLPEKERNGLNKGFWDKFLSFLEFKDWSSKTRTEKLEVIGQRFSDISILVAMLQQGMLSAALVYDWAKHWGKIAKTLLALGSGIGTYIARFCLVGWFSRMGWKPILPAIAKLMTKEFWKGLTCSDYAKGIIKILSAIPAGFAATSFGGNSFNGCMFIFQILGWEIFKKFGFQMAIAAPLFWCNFALYYNKQQECLGWLRNEISLFFTESTYRHEAKRVASYVVRGLREQLRKAYEEYDRLGYTGSLTRVTNQYLRWQSKQIGFHKLENLTQEECDFLIAKLEEIFEENKKPGAKFHKVFTKEMIDEFRHMLLHEETKTANFTKNALAGFFMAIVLGGEWNMQELTVVSSKYLAKTWSWMEWLATVCEQDTWHGTLAAWMTLGSIATMFASASFPFVRNIWKRLTGETPAIDYQGEWNKASFLFGGLTSALSSTPNLRETYYALQESGVVGLLAAAAIGTAFGAPFILDWSGMAYALSTGFLFKFLNWATTWGAKAKAELTKVQRINQVTHTIENFLSGLQQFLDDPSHTQEELLDFCKIILPPEVLDRIPKDNSNQLWHAIKTTFGDLFSCSKPTKPFQGPALPHERQFIEDDTDSAYQALPGGDAESPFATRPTFTPGTPALAFALDYSDKFLRQDYLNCSGLSLAIENVD